jgi:hypothetical protein
MIEQTQCPVEKLAVADGFITMQDQRLIPARGKDGVKKS